MKSQQCVSQEYKTILPLSADLKQMTGTTSKYVVRDTPDDWNIGQIDFLMWKHITTTELPRQ